MSIKNAVSNVNSDTNPYARFIAGRPVEEILTTTWETLSSLAAKLGPEKLNHSPAPGKWTPAEILAHLADCEIAFGFRLRQTLAADEDTGSHRVQPFDQDKWAASYPGMSALASNNGSTLAEQALATFAALRSWNMMLIRSALPAAAGKHVIHPERGLMTFMTIVETMAGHDVNHLNQLEAIAGS